MNLFYILVTISLCLSFVFMKDKFNLWLIVSNLFITSAAMSIFSAFNLDNEAVGFGYYLFIALVEFVFVHISFFFKSHKTFSFIFLASLIYNYCSLLEYETENSFIFNNYEGVNQAFITILILRIIWSVLDGTNRKRFNIVRGVNNRSVHARATL